MTEQEAIEDLRIQIFALESMIACNKDFEAEAKNEGLQKRMDVAALSIAALEKQIPKKADKQSPWMQTSYFKCPECGEILSINKAFCYGCGQAIDWNEQFIEESH